MLVFRHVNEHTQVHLLSVMQHCIADTCNDATSSMDTVLSHSEFAVFWL